MDLKLEYKTVLIEGRLDAAQVTFVYTMFHHLGDFVVMAGLLRKFDLLHAEVETVVAHQNSPHVSLFLEKTENRFFNVATMGGLLSLIRKLRREKRMGRVIFGLPMAPGSVQAFCFFWLLKKLGAITYIVDFNLINADILTPPRRRYIFNRHLAQAAELMKRPEWLNDMSMPLGISYPVLKRNCIGRRIGFYPESARAWLPEFKWPDACWLELAGMILQNPDCEIILIGRGKAFAELERIFRSQIPEKIQTRIGSLTSTSVEELINALQSLDFLITVNTSALHLAHALKIPLVALCGTSAEMWLPEGEHIRIIQDKAAPLPPSDKYRHDPLQPSLQRIQVQEVHSVFLDLFKKVLTTS